MTETQLVDERPVGLEVGPLEVVEEATTRTHHHQEPSSSMVVLLMGAEMLGERIDALREHRDLDPGRSRVSVVHRVFLRYRLLINRHGTYILHTAGSPLVARPNL